MSEEKTIKFKSGACIKFFGEDDGSSFVGFNSSATHLDDLDVENQKCCDNLEDLGE